MKKRMCTMALSVLMCLAMFGCSTTTSEAESSPKQTPEPQVEVQVSKYKINKTSSIKDDFDLFGLEMKAEKKDLALFDICSMFPDESTVYLYLRMPEDTDQVADRVQSIFINDVKYETILLEVSGNYQKYALEDFNFHEDGIYTVSEVDFINEKVEGSAETYNMSQIVIMTLDDTAFVFSQEYEYDVTLDGQLFESVYQFNKNNNMVVDLWSKTIGDIDQLDLDKRSFFYFGFNCYDVERDIQFIPEQIKQLDVEYTRLSYSYQGKDKDSYEHPEALSKDISETILPEHCTVIAENKKRSRKLAYEYNTINKLSEADLSKNVSATNAATLQQIAKQYTWAVQFGSEKGYEYLKEGAGILWLQNYDVRYTDIADFKAVHIVYVYDGATFDTKTNSLISNEVSVQPETTRKPTDVEENKEEDVRTKEEAPNGFVAIIQIVWNHLQRFMKPIVVVVAVFLVIYLAAKHPIKSHHRNRRRRENDKEDMSVLEAVKEWIKDKLD